MKKCEYCGGNAESGCGAVETAAGLYLHYSKIECAEVLKLQVEELQKYVQATEYWKIEPHDQKERAAWIQRLALKRELPVKNVEFFVEPCPKDWDGSPKGCWDPHPLTREICQLKPDGHKTHKRDDTTGKQFLCWVRT